MYWTSFSDFLAMGNHGVYVWGSVIVMAVAMIVEPLLLIGGQKSLVARLQRQFRAERLEQGADKHAARHAKGKH